MVCCCRSNCGVVFTIWPPPLPQHTRTQKYTYALFAAPSVLASAAAQHQCVCSASRQHLGNLSSLPPFLPLCRLSLSPASFFWPFMPFWNEWLSRCYRRGRQRRKRTSQRERENRDITDHQHAGHCRRDQEGMLLEQLEGPGYWCVYCDLLIISLCLWFWEIISCM